MDLACQSEGDDLIVYAPTSDGSTLHSRDLTFHLPPPIGADNLCLADYFAPVDSGIMDVVAFQVVTVGQAATERLSACRMPTITPKLISPTGWRPNRRSHRRISPPAYPPRIGA